MKEENKEKRKEVGRMRLGWSFLGEMVTNDHKSRSPGKKGKKETGSDLLLRGQRWSRRDCHGGSQGEVGGQVDQAKKQIEQEDFQHCEMSPRRRRIVKRMGGEGEDQRRGVDHVRPSSPLPPHQ